MALDTLERVLAGKILDTQIKEVINTLSTPTPTVDTVQQERIRILKLRKARQLHQFRNIAKTVGIEPSTFSRGGVALDIAAAQQAAALAVAQRVSLNAIGFTPGEITSMRIS